MGNGNWQEPNFMDLDMSKTNYRDAGYADAASYNRAREQNEAAKQARVRAENEARIAADAELSKQAAAKKATQLEWNKSKPYESLRGEDGLLRPNLQVHLPPGTMQGAQDYAMGNGLSPWTMLQLEGQGLERVQNVNKAMAGGGSPWGALADRGGSRVLGASAGAASGLDILQNTRPNSGDALSLMMGDRTDRNKALMDLPGKEIAALGPQQFNIQNALQDKRQEDISKMAEWGEKMKAYGAGQTSQGISSSGKK